MSKHTDGQKQTFKTDPEWIGILAAIESAMTGQPIQWCALKAKCIVEGATPEGFLDATYYPFSLESRQGLFFRWESEEIDWVGNSPLCAAAWNWPEVIKLRTEATARLRRSYAS